MLRFQNELWPHILLWDEENLLEQWHVEVDLLQIAHWIQKVNEDHSANRIQRIEIILLPMEEIARLHHFHFGDPDPTDVITLQWEEGREVLLYIAPEFIFRQLDLYQTCSPQEAFLRVLIHGILHVMGLKDGTPDELQTMREAEDRALSLWKTINAKFTP